MSKRVMCSLLLVTVALAATIFATAPVVEAQQAWVKCDNPGEVRGNLVCSSPCGSQKGFVFPVWAQIGVSACTPGNPWATAPTTTPGPRPALPKPTISFQQQNIGWVGCNSPYTVVGGTVCSPSCARGTTHTAVWAVYGVKCTPANPYASAPTAAPGQVQMIQPTPRPQWNIPTPQGTPPYFPGAEFEPPQFCYGYSATGQLVTLPCATPMPVLISTPKPVVQEKKDPPKDDRRGGQKDDGRPRGGSAGPCGPLKDAISLLVAAGTAIVNPVGGGAIAYVKETAARGLAIPGGCYGASISPLAMDVVEGGVTFLANHDVLVNFMVWP